MQRKIITTADGSSTIQIEEWNEQYHSMHGAIQEANHVYIKHGLLFYLEKFNLKASGASLENKSSETPTTISISILEIGFGTGLNALLTLLESSKHQVGVHYTGVEAYPITPEEIESLNYASQLQTPKTQQTFIKFHNAKWEMPVPISDQFTLEKQQKLFQEINEVNTFDLVYFDAFGARVQPELWTENIFELMFAALRENGVLVTYAAKGSVRRAMQAVGFKVEKLQGPPGKREMLRAVKHSA